MLVVASSSSVKFSKQGLPRNSCSPLLGSLLHFAQPAYRRPAVFFRPSPVFQPNLSHSTAPSLLSTNSRKYNSTHFHTHTHIYLRCQT
ncbi:hypothetical protein PtB15_1B47 [Puccinia triticina]|nr:hypothetical protein PtB15_1B47 [Puccinia triticina]